MRHILMAIFILTITLGPAMAQTQNDLDVQASNSYQKADNELNKTYHALLKALPPDSASLLQKSEKAFIAFREADGSAKEKVNEGGSIHYVVRFAWLQQLTEARTAQLKDWLKEATSH